MGIIWNIYQEVLHGPFKYQGLGIPSLYTSQDISHVEGLLDTSPQDGITGMLLLCLAEDLKLEIGLPSMLL